MSAPPLSDPIAREDRLFALRDDGPPTRRTLFMPARADNQAIVKAVENCLSVRLSSGQSRHFPFSRIGRIVTSPHVHWQGSALAQTLAHGITITWADGNGRFLGTAEPRQPRAFDTDTRIALYLEMPRWRQHFDNWHARRRLEVLNACATRDEAFGQPLDPEAYAERKRAFVHRGAVEAIFDDSAYSWCRAWIADFLFRAGVRARHYGFDGSELDLGAELTALLWAELNFDSGSLASTSHQDEAMRILWFDTWARRRPHRLESHLADFKRHIAQVLASPWQ